MNKNDENLFDAVATDDSAKIKDLLDGGANPNPINKNSDTPLHLAVRLRYIKVVRALLDSDKTNPNATKEDGWTVLMEAANVGDCDIAEILIDKGANPNTAKGYGWTALMEAAYCGHTEIVELLLEKVVNRNAALKVNWTALDAANLAWQNAKTPEEAKKFQTIVDMFQGKKAE